MKLFYNNMLKSCCFLVMLLIGSNAFSQTVISGRVTGNDDKKPIAGAAVTISGTTTGTSTGTDGRFIITAKPTDVLVISFVGYQRQELQVGSNTAPNIVLYPSQSNLNEVVVTGYTSQRKKDIAGAVSVVDINNARKLPTSSSEQLLQGQAAGVNVVTQGAPGANSYVYIRGVSNFGNSQPLYVVDGVQTGSMSNLNPNDIESIQVLKDAGAAAIYGISGGNGVVVVTTKKGKSGKTVFSYDAFYGTQQPKSGNVFNSLTPQEQSRLTYLAGDLTVAKAIYPGGAGTVPVYGYQGPGSAGVSDGTAAGFLDQYHFDASHPENDFLIQKFNQSGTDWFHSIYKSAPIQYHTISASGANEKNTYFMSVGYLDQQGTAINTYSKRYETRINTTFNINPHIRLGENAYFNYKQQPVPNNALINQSEGGALGLAYRALPQIPVYDIKGNYGGTYDGPGGEPLGNGANPVRGLDQLKNDRASQWNMQGNIFAEVDLFKHLTARTSIGGNISNQYNYGFTTNPYNDYENHLVTNTAYENATFFSQYNWTNTLVYKQTFGKHNITLLGGYEQKGFNARTVGATGESLFSVNPNYVNISNTSTQLSPPFSNNSPNPNGAYGDNTFGSGPTKTASVFARLDYIYADKYILGATVRRDGYSAFFNGKQYGTFPSASLAWRVSGEDFLKTVSWINDLKLRASYGIAGNNANVGAANAYSLYGSAFNNGYYAINGGNNTFQGFYNSSIGNQNTTWETDKILNFGLDASLFNHLDLGIEVYKKTVEGLLFPQQLPQTVGGASSPFVNIGNVENKGIDISAIYHGNVGSDFRFNLGLNLSINRGLITKLPNNYFDEVNTGRIGFVVREQVGHPFGQFFGYKTNGIFTAADIANKSIPKYAGAVEGSFKYAAMNGDTSITGNDKTFIGDPNPKFTYGINIGLIYKQFDFTMTLYGSQGNQDFNYTKYFTDFYNTFAGGKGHAALYNSYGAPGVTNPTVPIQTDKSDMGTDALSSYYVSDASYLKCRVAQIGYTFSPTALQGLGISKLHIYVQATNLFTITKYTGLDPEIPPVNNSGNNAFGVDFGNYPNNQKQYLIGLNLSF